MQKLSMEQLSRLSVEEYKKTSKTPVVVVLDNVRSALNVGSVFRTSDAFKLEKEGYLTQENKFYRSDKRNAISYTMRPDKFWEASVPSGLVNKFFSVKVSPDYYTKDKNGKIDPDRAWKLIHQILLNYFDEMQTTDLSSGFIQTPWEYERFSESRQAVRTRVTVKQSGISEDELVFQIKISSEEAPLVGMSNESSYREVVRILKKFEPLISEFQSRLSKN